MNTSIAFGILSLILCVDVVISKQRVCLTDMECKRDECCALSFTGQGKICREMGEHVGNVCGGSYFCPTCSRNLTCVQMVPLPAVHGLDTAPEVHSLLVHPANATCQNLTIVTPPVAEPEVVPVAL